MGTGCTYGTVKHHPVARVHPPFSTLNHHFSPIFSFNSRDFYTLNGCRCQFKKKQPNKQKKKTSFSKSTPATRGPPEKHLRADARSVCADTRLPAGGAQPPLALTDVRRLRGTLGREGCEDNEIQNVETKAQRKCEEGNTADCTSDEEEEEWEGGGVGGRRRRRKAGGSEEG